MSTKDPLPAIGYATALVATIFAFTQEINDDSDLG